MSTSVVFTPSSSAAFQFGATFDGNNYICTVTWNISGQRWYLNITTTTGDLVVCRALIASPVGYNINLLFGYFVTSTMVFLDATQTFVITP